jgi:hypothetical protein
MGQYAYLADRQGLKIVDVSNPAAPTTIGVYHIPHAAGLALDDNYVYIIDGDRLYIIDVSTPSVPHKTADYATSPGAQDVAVVRGYAHIATRSGVLIVDVADPTHPFFVRLYHTPEGARAVTLAESFAYVIDGNGDLHIIEVKYPTAAREIGFLDTPGEAQDVAVVGNYAYVTDSTGLHIINVADPTTPAQLGFYEINLASDVTVAEDYAYIATRDGVIVIGVTDPVAPFEVTSYSTIGSAKSATAGGNYIYVADDKGGLVILRRLRDKVTTSIPPAGGSLRSTAEDTWFLFPTGAFTQTVTLTYRHLWSAEDTGHLLDIGHAFELTAFCADTEEPIQLVPDQVYAMIVHYTDAEKGPAIENTLALYAWDGSRWVQEPTSVVDASNNTLIAMPSHLGLWAILGETWQQGLPLVLKND